MTDRAPRPPRLALWLHERSLAPRDREAVVGDLLEEFDERAALDRRAASRWLWAQTWRSLVPNLRRRVRGDLAVPIVPQQRGASMLNGLSTDVRVALRLLRRQPLGSLVAVVSLCAALGLNILLWTLADAVLFRPLALRAPHDLALLLLQRDAGRMHNFSYPDYRELRDGARSLDALVAYAPVDVTMARPDGAVTAGGEVVSGNFFEALGVPLRTGRTLTDADDRSASPPAIVISERLWRERFDGVDPMRLDRPVVLNGAPYTLVGVADAAFSGMQIGRHADFWIPIAHAQPLTGDDLRERPTTSWLTLLGRLEEGMTRERARDELDRIVRGVHEAGKRDVEPLILEDGARGDSMLSAQLGSPLRLLLGAGLVVLLVACLNVANLHLARTDARRLEFAVRSAIGARRAQLARLPMIDGAIVAGLGGLGGTWLAFLGMSSASSLIAFYGQPIALSIPTDVRAIAAAVVLTFGAALTIGLLSAWQALRSTRIAIDDARVAGSGKRTVQRALVVAQVALSMALIVGAALFVRTLDRLRHADLGFDSRGLVLVQVSPEMGKLTRPQASAYFDEALRTAAALPGVERAAVSHVMPLDFGGSRMTVDVAGYTPSAGEDMEINFVRISPEYFDTIGIPLRAGRTFDARDTLEAPERIVVNESMARKYWPDGNAVGKFLRFGGNPKFDVEVIGVVPDVRYRMVREPRQPSFYVSMRQFRTGAGVVHVRYGAGVEIGTARIDEVRRVMSSVDPNVPVTKVYTLQEQAERNIADERMAMSVGAVLALVALLLATAGLYATLAFGVGRRTREIGVRMALGARGADVRRLVLREGVTLAIVGVAVGLAISLWVGRALEHLLYGVGSVDLVSLTGAALTLTLAAVAASWIPARRAARVDPVIALRSE